MQDNDTFELSVNSFVRDVLTPAGYEVLALSRIPYVSIEDMVYVLHNAVFVVQASFAYSLMG